MGDELPPAGRGTGGWRISQGAGQSIRISGDDTVVATTDYLNSAESWDALHLVCAVANTHWQATWSSGGVGTCSGSGNLIPAMTSDTAPSGEASTTYSATYPPFHAFTTAGGGNPTSSWLTVSDTNTGWLKYQFPGAEVVARYELVSPSNFADARPQNRTFKGSDEGTTWTAHGTRSGATWTASEVKSFTLATPASFEYYHVDVTANAGYASWLNIGDWRMYCN